jgi:signal transduction histidine kinase
MDIPAEFNPSESTELLLLAEEIGRIGIIDWDVRAGAVRLSPNALAMYGLERFDGRYDSWIATVYREDVIRLRNVIAEAFEAKAREFELDFRIIRPSDNEMRWLLARRLAFYDKAGKPYRVVGVSVDVTDRKRELVELRNFTEALEAAVKERTRELEVRTRELEAENEARKKAEELLRQAQKMEAVGQLTGGVAHDFNNLLTIMQGGLEMIRRQVARLEPSPAISRIVRGKDMTLEAVQRATRLTERLLAFARRQPLEPRAIDGNRLVGGLCELLRRMVGETIDLETVLSGGLWVTLADFNQLENAILNLVLNARDAMPNGGKVTIETTNAHLDDPYVRKLAEPEKLGNTS